MRILILCVRSKEAEEPHPCKSKGAAPSPNRPRRSKGRRSELRPTSTTSAKAASAKAPANRSAKDEDARLKPGATSATICDYGGWSASNLFV
jgi:hypothetical protein